MLFHEEKLEQISSPEHLSDYIKVTNVRIWLVLIAIMFLLFGFCMWAVLGRLETTIKGIGEIKNNQWSIQTKEVKTYELEPGMKVLCEDEVGVIKTIQREDEVTVIKGGISGLLDGAYTCTITIESIEPITFLWN